jgi:tripartite-type tricarboxylate transporter receptor subunit TctC
VSQTTIAAKTVPELVAYAKANPNKSNYGTTSPAFTISSELFKLKTGAPGVALPLKSSAEMILCVIQEQCLFSISDGPPAIPQIKDGKVRATRGHRIGALARIAGRASMAEAGFPEVNTKLWSGMFAPASTPPAIVNKLQSAFLARDPRSGVAAKLRGMAVNPGGGSSDEFRKMIDADIESYVAVGEGCQPEVRAVVKAILGYGLAVVPRMRRLFGIAAALALSAPAAAQAPAALKGDFKGETINISVGYPAGGAPDLYFRVLSRHYARHIPGNPLIVIKNMPGAGTLRAANYIYNVAAKDGTELGNFSSSATMEPLMDNDQAKFRSHEVQLDRQHEPGD